MPGYDTPIPCEPSTDEVAAQESAAQSYTDRRALSTAIISPLIDTFRHTQVISPRSTDMFATNRTVDLNPDVDMRIGLVKLSIPPEKIEVNEQRYNEEVVTLRSRGNALIKTGRGHISIDLPIVFSGITSINTELKDIIAQFRACPFTVIENGFLASTVMAKRRDKSNGDNYLEAIRRKEDALIAYSTARRKAIETILELWKIHPTVLEAAIGTLSVVQTRLEDAMPSQMRAIYNSVTSAFVAAKGQVSVSLFNVWSIKHRVLQLIEDVEQALAAVEAAMRSVAEAAIDISSTLPVTPVALHQLVCQTVPGFPALIQANLEAWYFNTEPYIGRPTFVGPMMNPTFDITQCQAYKDQVDRAGEAIIGPVSLSGVSYEGFDFLNIKYPTTDLKKVEKGTVPPSPLSFSVPVMGEDRDKYEFQVQVRQLTTNKDHKNVIVDKITVSLANRLAPQPVESQMYGTLQYTGSVNARVNIVFTIAGDTPGECETWIRTIEEIKKQSEEVALLRGSKARRQSKLMIENELIKLFGVEYVLLDDIRVVTKGPCAAEVTMEFTEYTSSVERKERLILTKAGMRRKAGETTIKYLAGVIGASIHSVGAPAYQEAAKSWDSVQWAISAMYRENGVITTNLLATALGKMLGVSDEKITAAIQKPGFVSDPAQLLMQLYGNDGLTARRRMEKLAEECLAHWSLYPGSILTPLVGVRMPNSKLDSTATFPIDPVPSEDLLKVILENIVNNDEFLAERRRMLNVAEFGQSVFPALASKMEELRKNETDESLYPDLFLPDYATAFVKLWSTIKEIYGIDIYSYKNLNAIPDRIRGMVKLVIPTYADLGVTPPLGSKPTDMARSLTDTVEPDFFFFWRRMKNEGFMLQAEREAETAVSSSPVRLNPTNPAKIDAGDVAQATRKRTSWPTGGKPNEYGPPIPAETEFNNAPAILHTEADGKDRAINVGSVGSIYTPSPELKKTLSDINPHDEQHRKRLLGTCLQNIPDRFRRMITAFPTFKLYLIETDGEEWSTKDDWYSYNAVKSIRIHRHKITPAIAEIEIVNVTGDLDGSRAISSDQDKDAYEDRLRKADKEPETGDPAKLDHFFIDAGTPIVVKLGYSSKVEELETRITGQIVSVTSGDVITIVAQEYSSELTIPINTIIKGRNLRNIIKEIMEKSPTTHYGEWSIFEKAITVDNEEAFEMKEFADEQSMLTKKTSLGTATSRASWAPIGAVAGYPQRLLSDLIKDRKLMNVFLPETKNWLGIQGAGTGETWGIPNIIGLAAIHEVARHLPGYVFGTRPYDHQVTMFFGRPEEPYFFTDTNKDKEVAWNKNRNKTIAPFNADITSLFWQFMNSMWGEMLSVSVDSKLHQRYYRTEDILGAAAISGFRAMLNVFKAFGRIAGIPPETVETTIFSSPPVTTELHQIEDKLGQQSLHLLAAEFFNLYGEGTDLGETMAALQPASLLASIVTGGEPIHLSGPGYTLYFYHNWRHALEIISGQVGSGFKQQIPQNDMDKIVRQAFQEFNDPDAEIRSTTNFIINRQRFLHAVQEIIRLISVWKEFLWLFNNFLQEQSNTPLITDIASRASLVSSLTMNPRMKRFRNHYIADSSLDIIKNDIAASREFMANTIIVGYQKGAEFEETVSKGMVWYKGNPGTDSLELGFNDDIEPGDHVVRVITEQNAVNKCQAYLCAKSNLAEALRPMYRGQILLRGHEKLYPHDIIWLSDTYNGIYGPIEAESVIDQFDQTGYFVTVIPHAVVWAESGSEYADNVSIGTWWMYAATGVAILGFIPTFGATASIPVIAVALKAHEVESQTGHTLDTEIKNQVYEWVIGQSMYGGVDPHVRIIPLVKNGLPWTAGMRGIGKGGWKARLGRKWEAIKAGSKIVWDRIVG